MVSKELTDYRTPITHIDWAACSMSFEESFAGSQREVCYHVIEEMLDGKMDRPVHMMWAGYESALAIYGIQMCFCFHHKRGLSDRWQFQIHNLLEERKFQMGFVEPPWRRDEDVMRSHRSWLLRQDPARYRKVYGRKLPDNLPFLWPIIEEDSYFLAIDKETEKFVNKKVLKIPEEIREWVSVL